MDQNDRKAIEGLFDKLAQVERQSPARDAEAERFIAQSISGQPGAPYFMAQTIVVQEQALNAAQARIAALEAGVQRQPAPQPQSAQGGGLFSRVFGNGQSSVPQVSRQRPPAPPAGGGGFLAGAAQTAMGVAGGMLLGNAIAGMFGGGAAHAAEPAPAEDQDPGYDEVDDGGMDDGGDWGE